MELQQINQRIAVVNAESKRLNNERQVLIGKRQTLDKQLSDLLANYKKEYGIELTVETIGEEIARVSALKEAEVSAIETMLGLIREGRFEEAEKIASGEVGVVGGVDEDGAGDAVVPGVSAPAEPQLGGANVPPIPQSAPVAPPSVAVEPPMAPPAPPVAPELPTFAQPQADVPPAPPAAPPTFTKPAADVSSVPPSDPPAPPPPFTRKPPAGAPKLGVPPTVGTAGTQRMSFQAILNGTEFNPQGG